MTFCAQIEFIFLVFVKERVTRRPFIGQLVVKINLLMGRSKITSSSKGKSLNKREKDPPLTECSRT